MLKADVLGQGKMRFYDDMFDGYYVVVERKVVEAIGVTNVSWGTVYLVLPEGGPHALDHGNAYLLADALAGMLKAAAHMARLMSVDETPIPADQIDGS